MKFVQKRIGASRGSNACCSQRFAEVVKCRCDGGRLQIPIGAALRNYNVWRQLATLLFERHLEGLMLPGIRCVALPG